MVPPVVKTGNLKSLRTWSDVRDAVAPITCCQPSTRLPAPITISAAISPTRWRICWLPAAPLDPRRHHVETEAARVRPIDADLQVPDTRKFENHTGWRPEIGFETTMTDLLDYWRQRIASGAVPLTR